MAQFVLPDTTSSLGEEEPAAAAGVELGRTRGGEREAAPRGPGPSARHGDPGELSEGRGMQGPHSGVLGQGGPVVRLGSGSALQGSSLNAGDREPEEQGSHLGVLGQGGPMVSQGSGPGTGDVQPERMPGVQDTRGQHGGTPGPGPDSAAGEGEAAAEDAVSAGSGAKIDPR